MAIKLFPEQQELTKIYETKTSDVTDTMYQRWIKRKIN